MGRRNEAISRTLLAAIEERTAFEAWPSTFELIAITFDLPSKGMNGTVIMPNEASRVRRALNHLAADGRVVRTQAWRNHPARWCTPQAYAAYKAQPEISSAIKRERMKLVGHRDRAAMTALVQER